MARRRPLTIVHPIYAEMASALADEPAADLLKEPDVAAWKFPPAEIKPYVDEIKSIQESVLVLNRVQQEERINVIVERAVGELLGGERAAAVRRRLEDMAYYMARSGRREAAGWAAAAAARLRDGADPRRIPFFQALIRAQLGAVFARSAGARARRAAPYHDASRGDAGSAATDAAAAALSRAARALAPVPIGL